MRICRVFILALLMSAIPALAQINVGFGGVAHDASQAIEVNADNLVMNQEAGNAVFSGNVLIVQGDLRMTAGEVTVLYDTQEEGDGSMVRQVNAGGGVLITRGNDAAKGQTAVYLVRAAMLTLGGNVLVTQGSTAISGDQLVVNLATGAGTVEGRVRTVLQPGGNTE
ncbi:MAG: lipopolysaccharide transport periplasmic protein LptA [Rhodobacteraceae bacterium]|nr:lipopolysaccharide transport periplasmic protein LptA [Paracoccaceae bacterium]